MRDTFSGLIDTANCGSYVCSACYFLVYKVMSRLSVVSVIDKLMRALLFTRQGFLADRKINAEILTTVKRAGHACNFLSTTFSASFCLFERFQKKEL